MFNMWQEMIEFVSLVFEIFLGFKKINFDNGFLFYFSFQKIFWFKVN